MNKILLKIYILIFLFAFSVDYSQCGPTTPSFTANLACCPTGTWTSPVVQRADSCCGSLSPDICVKFTIILSPSAMGINFGIASGAIPPGALFYQINCGPPIAVGTPICLSGAGPHILTFCKPGNNNNTYSISSIPSPVVPDSILIRSGCTGTLAVSGFSVPTINWNSINPGLPGAYNSYLSCTSGCATVNVVPTGTPPAFVDYEVSGFGQSPCQANFFKDTVRVYFFSDLIASINPTLTTICFGQTNAVLTGSASGGLPAYTYSWSTGSTSTSVTVGPGTYTFTVNDKTGCPPTTATAVVNSFTLPITANAGPDLLVCKTNPAANLNGAVTSASSAIWSGGTGTISPSVNSYSITYTPTPAELAFGFVQLYFTTVGNYGCPPDQDTVNITFQNVSITNPGPASTVCANNNIVNLSGSITGYSNTGQWSSSGSGTFGSITSLNTTYIPSLADVTAGTVTLTLTSTNNGSCPPASSSVVITITPPPLVNAGIGQTICSSNSAALNGSVTGGATTGNWTTSGSGIFNPSSSVLNASYIPSLADISAGTVTLTLSSTNNGNCIPVSDTIIITIKRLAIVNAGNNLSLCSTSNSIALAGNISGGTTTGIWNASGTGAYFPSNLNLNTAYIITPADIIAGSVTFTLTSTNNGPCPAISDTVKVSITKLAIVNAGSNQNICSNAGFINLSGNISGASGNGVWQSSGIGTFSPGITSLMTSYSLTPSDISSGYVTFTLTSLNNGPCPAITDSVKISLTTIANVNAGINQLICSSTGTIGLSGTINGSTNSGVWATNGTGPFSPSSTSLSSTYYITVSDVTSGILTFSLTSLNNGVCPAVTDTMQVIINQVATSYAGLNQNICSNASNINLSGIIGGGTSTGVWNSSGSGNYTPSNTSLNTSYSITTNDINNGFVTFTLSTTNNGACPVIRDTVKVTIKKLATVNAGLNQSICSINPIVSLNGSIGGGTSSGIWSTTGTGSFSPSNTFLSSSYNLSQTDVSNSNVYLILTSTNNGVCPPVSDSVKVNIMLQPIININADTVICAYGNKFTAFASLTGGSGNLQWTSNGTGYFSPQSFINPVTYNFSSSDISAGFVNLIITSINNGPCGSPSATMNVVIKPVPIANFSASTYTAYIPNDPISFTNLSNGANSFYWYFNDGDFSTITNPIHTFHQVGYYTVGLIAINQYGCRDTTEQQVTIISDIQFPNVFTPNPSGPNGGSYNANDYSNDVFFPYTSGVTEYKLMIFNRWGELIFISKDINIGWDGYFNGKLCQQDAYVWKVDLKFFDGRKYNKTGTVTLLK